MADPEFLRMLGTAPATRRELQTRLRLSQPSVSRLLARHADEVVVLGRVRATRYALRRAVRGLPAGLPVFRIDPMGHAAEIGTLVPVHGGTAFDDAGRGVAEVHDGLPWFLTDMRPQGFIGRTFVRQFADLGLPARLSDWSDDHALLAIARRGEDAVGNLIVGEESFTRWTQAPPASPVPAARRARVYPRMAEQALAGELPGSSAGGEQPKFTAYVSGDPVPRHVLVKFTEPLDTQAGRRWADLLACEHLALRAVAAAGLPAARSEVIDGGGRRFLEVERFDRVGPLGRMGVISLAALDDQFVGQRRDWSASARELLRLRRISREDAGHIAWLHAFGRLIANTDMHFGNVSLLHQGEPRLPLAPAYDMLPMLYAPVRGEVRTPAFAQPQPPPLALAQVPGARAAAIGFWESVEQERLVSRDFRLVAGANALMLRHGQ